MPGKIQVSCIFLNKSSELSTELLDRTLKGISKLLPGAPVFGNFEYPGVKTVSGANAFQVAKQSYALTATHAPLGPDDGIAIFHGLCPFLDPDLSAEATERHLKFYAHYTYSENIPAGFMPDLASADFLSEVPDPGPQDIREFVFKNIEKYDVEIVFRLPDLRQYRLDFSASSPRSTNLALQIAGMNPDLRYAELEKTILDNPQVLRPFPSFFEIDVTTRSALAPIFLPERAEKSQVDFSVLLVDKLNAEIKDHRWDSDVTVCLGGRGDPLLHPDISDILQKLLSNQTIGTIFLETFGQDLTKELLSTWQAYAGIEKLHIIIRLSTLKKDRYQFLYGKDLLPPVLSNIEHIEKLSGKDRPFKVYVEMLKIKDVEDEIDPFYDRFEKSPVQIILNKYNRYIDVLPERRVSDLTPLHRDFCWHLARDVFLRPDGKTSICKQDPNGTRAPSSDFATRTISQILSETLQYHSASVKGDHTKIPMPCMNCDEWYTFNG